MGVFIFKWIFFKITVKCGGAQRLPSKFIRNRNTNKKKPARWRDKVANESRMDGFVLITEQRYHIEGELSTRSFGRVVLNFTL